MAHLVRLAAATLACFVIVLLTSTLESTSPQPLEPIILSIVLTIITAGFAAGSAPLASIGTLIGGTLALITGFLLGVKLWPSTPLLSDLFIIRLLLLGGAALLAAGVGYVSSNIFTKPSAAPAEGMEQPQPPLQKTETPTVEQSSTLTSTPSSELVVSPGTADSRICKFCDSVIPADSIFCPMCGAKLVEIQ